ncbi:MULTISPECIES: hypothetical protein [Paraburkholderia]|jgi:hypothetical protein|nr:hypothetical protein [Paraburkholderia phenazinium]
MLLRNLARKAAPPAEEHYPMALARPSIIHTPPSQVSVGQLLQLQVRASPHTNVTGIRLHYRQLNALEEVYTLEVSGANAVFAIPAEEISGKFDLLCYFKKQQAALKLAIRLMLLN